MQPGVPDKPLAPSRGDSGSFNHIDFLYNDDTAVPCPTCGWIGRPSECSTETHLSAELYEVCCPSCDAKIANLPFASHDEIRAAAEAGNPKAIAELPDLDEVEAFHARGQASRLADAASLPELEGDAIELLWDFEPGGHGEDATTVIRHGDREIWREVAYWEAGDRFAEVFTILRRRYGWRLVSLDPTAESLLWLGGDHFTLDYRRADAGLANLDPAQPMELVLSSVTDGAGRLFHVLRQADLVVWRSPEPAAHPPTEDDAERLQEWVQRRYRRLVELAVEAPDSGAP